MSEPKPRGCDADANKNSYLRNARVGNRSQQGTSRNEQATTTSTGEPNLPESNNEAVPTTSRRIDSLRPRSESVPSAPTSNAKKPAPKRVSNLKKFMAERKRALKPNGSDEAIADPYQKATQARDMVKKETVLYIMPKLLIEEHYCPWDETHPECPARVITAIDRCIQLRLFERCTVIECKEMATDKDVLINHSVESVFHLRNATGASNVEAEQLATNYDSIYFSQGTEAAALHAVKTSLELVEKVAAGVYKNGFAFVRPPGHHAMFEEYNGYCYFNNVAIAVKNCIAKGLAKKVLIIDYDVHHGQGTQQAFYNTDKVLYFSIHRYEHGAFWPHLRESNFDHIGHGEGKGYNVNVPLNETGLSDKDYMAIVIHLLLPIAYDFNPDLIVVSAGYDAAIGCPEGEMKVSPVFYSHLMSLLSGLANGKIAVILEGGYFIPSLAEGVAETIKGLLGDPCRYLHRMDSPERSVVESINNVKCALFPYWKCFNKVNPLSEGRQLSNGSDDYYHNVKISYVGTPLMKPFETRANYPVNSDDTITQNSVILEQYLERSQSHPVPLPVCWFYDEKMLKHFGDEADLECPERLTAIFDRFDEFGLISRMERISTCHDDEVVWMSESHTPRYVEKVINSSIEPAKDLFVNRNTGRAVRTAVSGLLSVVDNVMLDKARSGIAVIRPPGHHAGKTTAEGFCFVNNVASAANYIINRYKKQRILILDFDVHHGNGTQELFYNSNKVLYISIHRFDEGRFYPCLQSGGADFVGEGIGIGFNINIPFNAPKMGNCEYIAVMQNIVLPVSYAFAPEVVLVSAGFDAGINDPLGGFKVDPIVFGHIIQMMRPLAFGKMVIALEGGYNIRTTSYAASICTKVLLGDPIPTPDDLYENFNMDCKRTIHQVRNIQGHYWPILQTYKVFTPDCFAEFSQDQ